jgi:tetratricopeptide (TPR) repeat protein
MEEGDRALDAKQYDLAITSFSRAAEAEPGNVAPRFQLALTLSLIGKHADAIPQYEKVLVLQPGLYEAQVNLALSYINTNKPDAAIPHLRAAVEQKPGDFRPALYLAQSLLATKQFAEAEAAFKKALAIEAMSAPAEAGVALALGYQGKVDEAAPHFQQAFNLDRTYRSSFVELAQLYEAAGRTKEAITFYRMFPDNPVALERLGVLLTEAGELPEAITALKDVVEKSPTPLRRIALAQAYVRNKQTAKAEAAIAEVVKTEPRDIELRLFYGKLLRDQRKFSQAAQEFLAVTKLDAKSAEAWSELGNVQIIAGEYAGALTAFDHVKALGAERPATAFYRGVALDRLNQFPEAIESYNQFLATNQGKFPDQEFQARQRVKTLEIELRKKR